MKQILDERWFERFCVASKESLRSEWLPNSAKITESEKELFLNNEIENPRFSPRKATTNELSGQKLEELLDEIRMHEKDAIVLDLYERKLKNQLRRKQLIRASLGKNDTAFYESSAAVYGKPRKKYFAYVAKRVTELAATNEKIFPRQAKRLRRLMAKIDVKDVDISADILPPVVTGKKPVTTIDEVLSIFNATLQRLEIEGWALATDATETRKRFAVNAFRKIVYLPSATFLLSPTKTVTDVQIEALAEHEIGVHARRAYEGSQSGLLLLQTGLDSYLVGEEGLAGYVQQQIEGATEFYGFDRYLAASLAVGMDGIQRDFRAVFSLMVDYYTLQNEESVHSNNTAIHRAWSVCERIFRGTTGLTAGTIFSKDVVYMEGNIDLWHLISENPSRFESLFLGKFNPINKRHVRSLQTLGILKEW